MRSPARIAAGVAVFVATAGLHALERGGDPDSPAVRAAAREALKRSRILDVSGRSLDIVGLTRDVEGLLRELGANVTRQEVRIALQAEVLFDFGRHDLRPEAEPTLRKVAEVIRANPGPVTVEGHTDAKGGDAYNLKLSERRATSVGDWLVRRAGLEPSRFRTLGFGKTRPVAPNASPDGGDDPAGRQRNRRVEIAIGRLP
jgi:outer membrane protein OmpA-like peptidoglycan-associated protein